jgi:hypothetical protein
MTIVRKKTMNKKTGEVKIYEYETDYFKEYYLKNKAYKSEEINCELCGMSSQRQFLSRHQRSNRCLKLRDKKLLQNLDNNNATLSSNAVILSCS